MASVRGLEGEASACLTPFVAPPSLSPHHACPYQGWGVFPSMYNQGSWSGTNYKASDKLLVNEDSLRIVDLRPLINSEHLTATWEIFIDHANVPLPMSRRKEGKRDVGRRVGISRSTDPRPRQDPEVQALTQHRVPELVEFARRTTSSRSFAAT